MLATTGAIVLTLTWTNLVLSCPPSSEITEIQDIRLCNGSLLSIKFNLSDSCSNILGKVDPYIYQYSGGTEIDHVSWGYSPYSDGDLLCGITARLGNPLIINVNQFNRTNFLQIRLREIFSSNSETCSNNFHVFLDYTGFLGPPVNISSNSDNCSSINVTWSNPDYQCGIEPVYYNLTIYDTITGSLVDTVSVYGTSYQFVDNNLFIHHYTYVITGVNELGEGISNNDTFSYQRVPKLAVEHIRLEISNHTEDMVIVLYHALVTLECTGEAPGNIRVTIQCNGTVVYDNIYLVKYTNQSINVTVLVPVTLNQQCTIGILFNNSAGTSEPYVSKFVATPPLPSYTSSSIPTVSITPTLSSTLIITTLLFGILVGLSLLIAVTLLSLMLYLRRKKIKNYKILNYYEVRQEQSLQELEQVSSDLEQGSTELVRCSAAPVSSKDMGDNISLQPMGKGPNNDDYEAAGKSGTFSETEITVKIETNKKQQKFSNIENTTTSTGGGAITRGATTYPKASLPETEAPSVQCTNDTVYEINSNLTQLQYYNQVVSASFVIGAIGGNTNPLLMPKKNERAATTSQEVNSETDTSRILPHVDDPVIAKTQARTPTENKMVTGIGEKVSAIDRAEISNVNFSITQTNFGDHKQPIEFDESLLSSVRSLTHDEETSVNKNGTSHLTCLAQSTDSTDATISHVNLVAPSLPITKCLSCSQSSIVAV